MAKGRRTQARRTFSPALTALLLLAGLGLLAALALGLRGGDGGEAGVTFGGARTLTPVEGFVDVHGLALDPEDPSVLFVATHHGLVRGVDGGNWSLVGEFRADFMGFTMHPARGDVVWASGHPPGGGNLGVVRSDDGGYTWRLLGLPGVDFHAMTVSPADPDVLWGSYRGQLHRTQDGGATWSVVAASPPPLRSLAADPRDADVLEAATGSAIVRSADGGRTWTAASELPANALAIHHDDPAVRYAGTALGVARSADGGATWTPTALQAPAPVGYLALHPTDPDIVYAATYPTQTQPNHLYRTTDGGATWTRLA